MRRNFNRRGLRNFADTPIDRLCLAVEHGDLKQVEELLDRGVDPNGRNSRNMTPLVLASYYGYVDIAKALIDAGASVVQYVNQTTPIAQSIGVSLDMLKLLIDSGADVNAKANAIYGKAPLHQAVEYGLPDYAQVLLDAGADIEAKDNDGWTPLMTAVSECKRDMVKFLVEHGANINARNPDVGTALDLAIKDGISDIVSYLRNVQSPKQKNGKMSILDKKLLKSLVGKKPADIAGLLEAGANPNAIDDAGYSALFIAVSWDRLEDVKLLVEAGADIDMESGNEDLSGTPLTRSIIQKTDPTITKYLIEEGADVNKVANDWGDTALIEASNKPVFTKLLLEAGADPNIGEVYHNKKTALLYATDYGNLAVVKMLVEAGADLEHRDEHGKTALDIATEGGHIKIAAYLRRFMNEQEKKGRHFSAYTDEEGDTLEDKLNIIRRVIWTGEKKNIDDYELLDLFRDRDLRRVSRATEAACDHLIDVISYLRGDTDERPLSLAVYRDAEVIHGSMDQYVRNLTRGILRDSARVSYKKKFNRELTRQLTAEVSKKDPSIPEIKRLIAEGAEVNVAGKDGLTLLMFACEGSKWNVVKVLLDAGAGSRKQDVDDYGNTAMMYAVFDDKADMIAPLVRSGVDPSQETDNGESPLSLATREASFATFNALLQNGADPSTTNSVGFSALMNAVNRDDIRFVKALVEAGADVNAVAMFGQSALGIAECRANELWNNKPAMKAKCLEIADYLRSVGAKPAGDVDVGYLD